MPTQLIEKGAGVRPKLAVFKFSSCDGCQLGLLNLEDELLDLVGAVDIAYFLEARRETQPPPYDIGLVEGSISTPEEAERIQQVRRDCKYLVSIGACATSGGIQALRNWADVEEFTRYVYATPGYISTLQRSTPIRNHVEVDFELRGCPIDKGQLVEVLSAFLNGRRPNVPTHSVCVECKRAGTVCVMVARGTPCLGPATQAGCGALCPSLGRDCYACFGPAAGANPESLVAAFGELGLSRREAAQKMRGITGWAPPFRRVADRLEGRSREPGGGRRGRDG